MEAPLREVGTPRLRTSATMSGAGVRAVAVEYPRPLGYVSSVCQPSAADHPLSAVLESGPRSAAQSRDKPVAMSMSISR
jgi:hypothetical protein